VDDVLKEKEKLYNELGLGADGLPKNIQNPEDINEEELA
jgi:hypothetical protein